MTGRAHSNDQQDQPEQGHDPRHRQKSSLLSPRAHDSHSICTGR